MQVGTKQTRALPRRNLNAGNTRPAIQRAIAYLKDNLARQVWRPGAVMPSSIRLARSAGVSPVTLLKAIAALKAEGLVNGVRRGPIRAGGVVQETDYSEPVKAAWQAKRVQLEKDILAGVFAHADVLPPFKELESRYGVCFRTMRKILQTMVDDGALALRKKRYELRGMAAGRQNRRIISIVNRVPVAPISALNKGQYRTPELLEQECLRRGFQSDIVEIDFYNPAEIRAAISGPLTSRPAAGYILDTWWFPETVFRRSYADLLTRLSALKKPVSILDEIGDLVLPVPFASNPLFQVFRIESKRAGTRLSRVLLDRGHRSIAFISATHGQSYSQLRFEGIAEQFMETGCPKVLPVVADKMEYPLEYLLAVAGFSDNLVRRILSVERTKSQAEGTFATFKRIQGRAGRLPLAADDIRTLRKNLSGIVDLAQSDIAGNFFEKMCRAFLIEAGCLMMEMSLRPLFEQALKHKERTAWMCVSDGIALAAIDFLRRHGIEVPGRISITGFDNETGRALDHRLTTYDFNATGFVHAMLDFIARPSRPRGLYHYNPIEVEGSVMVRETAGRAPG